MKKFTEMSWPIFNQAIEDYHKTDNVDTPINNPYEVKTIEYYLYLKCWIDTVQWHFEDIIRDPNIDPAEALVLKRRIDKSNQDRTDLVELIDSYFLDLYGYSFFVLGTLYYIGRWHILLHDLLTANLSV